MKNYEVVTTLVFTQTIKANNPLQAKDLVGQTFIGMEIYDAPTDEEMEVREIKPKKKCIKRKSR